MKPNVEKEEIHEINMRKCSDTNHSKRFSLYFYVDIFGSFFKFYDL